MSRPRGTFLGTLIFAVVVTALAWYFWSRYLKTSSAIYFDGTQLQNAPSTTGGGGINPQVQP